MKKKGIVKIFAVVLAIVIISVSTVVFADVGNINRYDSGSSSSSSSSHSYSSGPSYHVSSSSGGGGGSIGGLIVAVIVIGIVVFVVGRSKGKINNIKDMTDINKVKDVLNDLGNDTSTSTVNTNTKGIAEEIRQSDPEFSEEKFLSWSKDVFVKLQAAWTARDWKIIRPFESNELFEQHNAQLQEYINNNRINVIERLAVESADLMSHRFDGDKEIIEVYLKAVMKDYIIDATTKEVVEGNKTRHVCRIR